MAEALPSHVSETDTARHILAPYCKGVGLDMGFGGSAITPEAITFDMPQAYTSVGKDRQILRGDCRRLPFVCDGSLDWIHSSHLLEDFTYQDLVPILKEWRRCLKPGGLLLTNCPNQSKFLAHCQKSGQGVNLAHKEATFSLETFISEVLNKTGPWKEVFREPNHGPYSFLYICSKE